MPRFFLAPELLTSGSALLTGEHAAHAKVLRLRAGDRVTLCDGAGTDYPGAIESAEPGCYRVALDPAEPSASEPDVAVTVYMAFSKADKFEHVIQKATELGTSAVVGFPSAPSELLARPAHPALRDGAALRAERRDVRARPAIIFNEKTTRFRERMNLLHGKKQRKNRVAARRRRNRSL